MRLVYSIRHNNDTYIYHRYNNSIVKYCNKLVKLNNKVIKKMADNTNNKVTKSAENVTLARMMRGKKLSDNTKEQYDRKFDHFLLWLKDNYPNCFDANDNFIPLSVETEIFEDFFGHICKKRNLKTGEYLFNEKDQDFEYQSFEHVSGYKSAIKNFYKSKRIRLSEETNDVLTEFFAGYERQIGNLKQDGKMSITEGKAALSFAGYSFLAKTAMTQAVDFTLCIFAHVFLLFCWNLIARCASVSSIMYDHISWEMDSMVIVFPTHKGDKEGKTSLPKHVYANRKCPWICPILSLFAIYLFTTGFRRAGAKRTVFGETKETESRFSKWLKATCGSFVEDLLIMGIIIAEIGSHSFRKGISTFLSSLCSGPSAIAIYLRAGWSLGKMIYFNFIIKQ